MDKPAENQFLLKLPKHVRDYLPDEATRIDIDLNQVLQKKGCRDRERVFP